MPSGHLKSGPVEKWVSGGEEVEDGFLLLITFYVQGTSQCKTSFEKKIIQRKPAPHWSEVQKLNLGGDV
jgi:hypothetical protein